MAERLHRPTIAALASGNGSTLEALVHATQGYYPSLRADISLVVCNNTPETAGVYERVNRLNGRYGLDIEMVHISGKTHPGGQTDRGQTLEESETIAELLRDGDFDHIALLGYMKIIRGVLLTEYGCQSPYNSGFQPRMSNTHPGPLPETADMYGIAAAAHVLDLGLTASRHTVHLVAAQVDQGRIIAEHRVEVLPGDTPESLFARTQTVERASLPYALDRFLREQGLYQQEQMRVGQ